MPNILTFITQLGTLLVIFYFVKKLLWKPARNILNTRAVKMQEDLDTASKNKAEAEQYLSDAKTKLNDARTKSNEIIEDATKDAKVEANKIISDAKAKADKEVDDAKKRIEIERENVKNEIYDEIVSVALETTNKILKDSSSSEVDEKIVEDFLKGNK